MFFRYRLRFHQNSFQVKYLRSKGGKNLKDAVLRMLNATMTNDMQASFNRSGKKGKLSFVDHLEAPFKGEFFYIL